MALTKNVELRGGVIVTGAYHRIERVNLFTPKGENTCVVTVAVYKDADARADNVTTPIELREYPIEFPQDRVGNIYAQAYVILKQLPMYEGALDA